MIAQVSELGEATIAEFASKWPRAIVTVHVTAQIARSRERLGAFRAFVRFLLQKNKTNKKFD